MLLLTLRKIHFIDRPEVQIVAYVARVKSWLGQWTVANNFHLIPVQDQNKHVALAVWRDQFLSSMKTIGLKPAYDAAEDFIFDYEVHDLIENTPLNYKELEHIGLHQIKDPR